MPRCSTAGLDFIIIPAGFNAPLEFLTGFIKLKIIIEMQFVNPSARTPFGQNIRLNLLRGLRPKAQG